MRKLFTSILLIGTCLSLIVAAGCAKKTNRTTKVTVAGEATTRVEPDTAVLVLAVVTESAQAITAQQENARKSDAVTTAVKNLAGSSAEIKTSDYTLQPQYNYRENQLPKIIGYDARNSVIVTTSDLKNVGALIDAASRAGANSIDSVSFTLRQTSPARGQALADATQQAMNKARSIAQALGGRVLRVVEENEGSTVAAEPQAYDMAARETINTTKMMPTPITAGQLSIRSNVQLIVEIES
ncbi:MAG: hypothetical protein DMF74_08865 [Acidobacteria bacterium]|nr:MAG: hypothetical protein DMF74_08865 [Acidobacteriota bacterium]